MRWLMLVFVMTACTTLNPITASQLSGLDPLTSDPQGFAVTLDTQDQVSVQPNGATLFLSVANPNLGQVSGRWVLDEEIDAAGRTTYRLNEQDVVHVRRLQRTASNWEEADPEGTKGSLSVSVDPCRTQDGVRLKDPRISVFITIEPGKCPAPLFRNAPLEHVMTRPELNALPVCNPH